MTAAIHSISFDYRHFPLSPYAEKVEIKDLYDTIVIQVSGLSRKFTQYGQILNADTSPGLKCAGEEICHMHIDLVGSPRDPSLQFDIINREDKLIYRASLSLFDVHGHIAEMFYDLKRWDSLPKDEENFLRTWGVKYLKKQVFRDNLIASDDFWRDFNDHLRTAIRPIYMRMLGLRYDNIDKHIHIINATRPEI